MFAVSCETIKEGTIVDKFYEPKVTYTILEHGYIVGMFKSTTKTDDEDYVFIISGKTKSGDVVTKRFEVSKNMYHKYEKGDYIKL